MCRWYDGRVCLRDGYLKLCSSLADKACGWGVHGLFKGSGKGIDILEALGRIFGHGCLDDMVKMSGKGR